jgi:hypothetical protein
MNAPLSMVGFDPTTQWFSPALLLIYESTTAVQMLVRGKVWVVGSSPTMESAVA